ncbi:fibrinogen-like protein 1 [Lingula anatina]|uniref:Fibrinogen-like protein 1 n=1 Tax=Lingula anatina TaxID=7574 RepID=A0A1S3K7N5_LINAN|nr:fibrinogen-like protein 1 [Lingula anatina]XP_013418507.1 fibrinogen-like protein 1 [Lingula anatina]|eukprot:XP_013418506.1 fibrinogen-like protein 1 [Lingula anatina]
MSNVHFLLAAIIVAISSGQTDVEQQDSEQPISFKTEKCTYNLVVHEMDTSRCPTFTKGLIQDQIPVQGNEITAKQEELEEVEDRIDSLEKQLLREIVKNRIMNSTLTRYDVALQRAESLLWEQRSNMTHLSDRVQELEKSLEYQKVKTNSLDKKLSSVMINVGEVINYVEKKLPKGTNIYEKAIAVQAASAVQTCGISDNHTIFKDCEDVHYQGHKASGVYYVKPLYGSCPIPVWCDMDTLPGGWMLLQRRESNKVDFNRNWAEYRKGFGDVTRDFWIGNENLFLFTNQDFYKLRVDLWDFYGSRVYAEYLFFKVDGERDQYMIHIANYTGTARDGFSKHEGNKFSTYDNDNDSWSEYHCAKDWKGGWWYNNCWYVILNGPYYNETDVKYKGISWNEWKSEQLKKVEMKIRPSFFYDNN